MNQDDLNRRDFHRLAAAAFGGMLAGTAIGCGKSEPPPATPAPSPAPNTTPATTSTEPTAEENLLLDEPHVCRGLNTCKGKGKGGDNACAGQGACASVAAHTCAGENQCKGQGGCGNNPGQNACQGKGGCSVPLMDSIWNTARKNFETAMQSAGKEFGAAPAATK